MIAWDKDPSRLKTEGIASERLVTQQIDLTDSRAVASAAENFILTYGAPHILVNNAGIQGAIAAVEDQTDADWQRVLDVNLTTVFTVTRSFLAAMRGQGYGRIINMASVAGVCGLPDGCAYGASKAAVIGFSKGLAKELMLSGVTVNCVAPALIDTELQEQMTSEYLAEVTSRIPMKRLGRPEEVAEMVGWIASPASSFTTGAVFDVSGGRLGY
ncbi:hypothetical protein AQY21_05850 [Paracoccus sp. MKU1]|nr:hypothetical protein AQY21_05850 [Paracoccus sp. MKU1]